MPGGPEVVVILLVALIVLGPDQLPKAMRTFGQALAEIRKVSSGFQNEMRNVMDTIDSTARDAVSTTPKASVPSDQQSPTDAGGQVDEVVARNEAPRSPDVSAEDHGGGSAGSPASTPGSSAADRAAG